MKFVLPVAFNEPGQLFELATTADTCGWEALSVSDHVVHLEKLDTPYPYTADGSRRWQAFTPWPDPWVTIAALAAVTQRLRFTNNAFVLPLRNPFLVAKAVGTAAVLSSDRVTLTIGVGWSPEEFALMEQPFRSRGRRADEMIEVMRKLWSGQMVEHHGTFYDFERLEMTPAPSAPVPIWVAGISEFALRRAARLGDGWLSDLQTSDEIATCIETLRRLRGDSERAGEPLEVMASASDAYDLDGYRRLEDAGVTHILTIPWLFYHGATDRLDHKCDGIRRFADDVISRMT